MRIALFTETFLPHTDGIVTRLTHTVEELVRAGDEVLLVAPAAPGLPTEYGGARVIGVPSVRSPVYRSLRLGLPFPVETTRAELRAFAPDIIHAVNPFTTGLGALYYAKRESVPLVASYHTNVATYARRYHLGALERPAWVYFRVIHNRALLNLCTSRPVQAMLEGRGFQRVALWAPGVDATLFHPARRSREWRAHLTGGHPEATIVLSVGRLAPEKGLDLLAPVLPHLPGCHLTFIGQGPAAGALRQTFAGLPVTFLGPLYGEELASAYAAADIFVLPSSTETLGLVAIEAMAAGLPVVGARRGGIPDIVQDGETGLLFDPDAPGDLSRALTLLATSADERERMGHAARLRAAAWSWAATTDGLRTHYARLLREAPTRVDSTLPSGRL